MTAPHTTTDPACEHYRVPRTAAEQEHYDRARGMPCLVCVPLSERTWTPEVHDPRDLTALEGEDDWDPDAGRDDVLDDDQVDDDSHVEREPWTLRLRARVRRELALFACLGWSAHHACTHRTALASGGAA